MKIVKILLFILLFSLQLFSQTYKDPSAKIEKRIVDLISVMTLEEKIGQMQQSTLHGDFDDYIEKVKDGKIGSFLNAGDLEDKARLQKAAVEGSRLGVPLIFGRDVIHGYKTMLPIPLGQAASWNEELIEMGSKMAAREASEDGIHWTFAPMIDISRDPRWGRIAESCGEDPYLTSRLGVAMIKGFQGDDLADKSTIAACAKHYVGYGASEGGKDYNTTLIPERELRDIYLKPFHAAVEAGAATLMSGFNDLDGVPASGNSFTLKKILRDEWGFNGFVVSDWASITQMIIHGNANDETEAALIAASAGINMEMATESFANNIFNLVQEGKIEEKWIDELVSQILRIKFKLGLFETPYTRITKDLKTLSPEFMQIAKDAATESIVMLQNDNTLPLKNVSKLAIIGPLADAPLEQLGTWTVDGKPENTITPLKAIKDQYSNTIEISYVKGLESARSYNKDGFQKAVDAVKKSDAAILFLGEDHLLSGESHSRAFLNLPGAQKELISELSKTGRPIILVIMAGRPLTFGDITDKVNSILYAWHPGTMGGPAIADIIFGKTSPSGKLPISFPRTVGQIPLYYNHKNTGRPPAQDQLGIRLGTPENPRGYASYYLDVDFTPAYYFGFGLSYAELEYSELHISSGSITMNDTLEISIKVKNLGDIEVKEVVQLYIRDLFGSVTRPVKELKNFKKINLNPGESQIVNFTLSSEDLKFYDINMEHKAEPGDFELSVGSSSNKNDLLKTKFTLKREKD